ncbi:MAG: hypothetical protein V5A43_01975 [Haloarculaceae archaeon]
MIEWSLPQTTYRRVDTATKVVGLALVAAGLEVGTGTPAGLLLAVTGTVSATITVLINNE